jgi:uncharacterized protein YukE
MTGTANRILLAALLILAAPLFAQSESLGDVARQQRANHQRSDVPGKVWTNEDLGVPEEGNAPVRADRADQKDSAAALNPKEAAGSAGEETKKAADAKDAKKADSEKTPEEKEAELQKRAQEGNQRYIDRIAAVQTDIASAQKELARLQRDQMESTNQFRRSNGTAPSVYEYQTQQRQYQQQIEEQQRLLVNLSQKLDEAREAARHAGVPHATDY